MLVLEHTRSAFDAELKELSVLLAEMGGLVEQQIAQATHALANGDEQRSSRVIAADALIDSLQRRVGEKAVDIIARCQPVAADLREVVGTLRIANELERLGDLAKNIAKRLAPIARQHMQRQLIGGVRHMTTVTLIQLRDALDSFVNRDVAKAVGVWTRDQDLDRLYTSLFRDLLTHMLEDPVGTITLGVHLIFCAKNLERMGDHATNIAEAVYYIVQGESLWRERPKADLTPSAMTKGFARWQPDCAGSMNGQHRIESGLSQSEHVDYDAKDIGVVDLPAEGLTTRADGG
jgi:phosphate transport system protein